MKILILGMPRSGTTNLSLAIGTSLGYNIYSEPFNYGAGRNGDGLYEDGEFHLNDNIVIKSMVTHIPKPLHGMPLMGFYKEYLPLFDKVIFLSRKDKTALLESYTFASENKIWHSIWVKTKPLNTDVYKDFLEEMEKSLEQVLVRFNYTMTWYEDLFSGDRKKIKKILKMWDIPTLEYEKMEKHINPEKRYRLPDNFKKTLI